MVRRVIVCGGRDYSDVEYVFSILDRVHSKKPIDVLVHGACPTGADKIADDWAASRGVKVERFVADWDNLKKAAGPIRNHLMANAGADGLIAFKGGKGTANMVHEAKRANIPVWVR